MDITFPKMSQGRDAVGQARQHTFEEGGRNRPGVIPQRNSCKQEQVADVIYDSKGVWQGLQGYRSHRGLMEDYHRPLQLALHIGDRVS